MADKVTVNGFDINSNTIYQVSPKFDGNAPDGFRKERTTKALAPWGVNIEGIPFNDTKKVWDTGLYESSPVFTTKKKEEVNSILRFVNKHIVDPLEKQFYGEGKLDHKDTKDSFWMDYGIELYNGRIFNTADPKQLMDLYLSVLHGKVCPKGEAESSPYFPNAQFSIENKESARTVQQENDMLMVEAMGLFHTMLNSDTKKLGLVLNYVGVKLPENAESGLITSSFTAFLNHKEDSRLNKEQFVKAAKLSNTQEGYDELFYFKKLQKLFLKKIVTKDRENILFEDTVLGTSFKEAAQKVAKEPKIQKELLKFEK
jgi:hypothetical protein